MNADAKPAVAPLEDPQPLALAIIDELEKIVSLIEAEARDKGVDSTKRAVITEAIAAQLYAEAGVQLIEVPNER